MASVGWNRHLPSGGRSTVNFWRFRWGVATIFMTGTECSGQGGGRRHRIDGAYAGSGHARPRFPSALPWMFSGPFHRDHVGPGNSTSAASSSEANWRTSSLVRRAWSEMAAPAGPASWRSRPRHSGPPARIAAARKCGAGASLILPNNRALAPPAAQAAGVTRKLGGGPSERARRQRRARGPFPRRRHRRRIGNPSAASTSGSAGAAFAGHDGRARLGGLPHGTPHANLSRCRHPPATSAAPQPEEARSSPGDDADEEDRGRHQAVQTG